jgi:hypothetical protein
MSTDPGSKDRDPAPGEPLEAIPSYVDPVERSIRGAIARGEFDNLPGAGKPLPGLDREYDPDWWARRYLDEARADEMRRTIRQELPFLRTMADRAAAAARAAELNAMVAEANRALPADDRIAPIVL